MKAAWVTCIAFCIAASVPTSAYTQPQDVEEPIAGRDIPRSFSECASRWREAATGLGDRSERFDCTRRLMEALRGAASGPNALVDAFDRAEQAARYYLEDQLQPRIDDLLQHGSDDGGTLSRTLLLQAYVREARIAAETKCDLRYDINGGAMSTVGASCRAEEIDRLISDLMALEDEIEALNRRN